MKIKAVMFATGPDVHADPNEGRLFFDRNIADFVKFISLEAQRQNAGSVRITLSAEFPKEIAESEE